VLLDFLYRLTQKDQEYLVDLRVLVFLEDLGNQYYPYCLEALAGRLVQQYLVFLEDLYFLWLLLFLVVLVVLADQYYLSVLVCQMNQWPLWDLVYPEVLQVL
jgi:hypothetical protein